MRSPPWLWMILLLGGCFIDRSGVGPNVSDGAIDGRTPDARVADATTDGRALRDGGRDARVLPDGWWNGSWAARRPLTIDNSLSSEVLPEFPVLILMSDDTFETSLLGPAGEQIRFVDGSGLPLPFEIEHWDPDGTSAVWLRVSLPASATTTIWLYYDNPSASDGQLADSVWSNGYAGVWHLDEGFEDSTAAGNDGSTSAASPSAGVIGRGRLFAPGQHSTVPDADSLDLAEGVTLTAWMRPTDLSHQLGILSKRESCEDESNYGLFIREDNLAQFEFYDEGWRTFAAGEVVTDRWHWLAATFDPVANRVVIYLDGERATAGFMSGRSLVTDENTLEIGRNGGCANDSMEGTLDEIRIADRVRSNSWLAAQYRSMTDSMVSVGDRQNLP